MVAAKKFKLPGSIEVSLHSLGVDDYDALNDWIRSEYARNIGSVPSLEAKDRERFLSGVVDRLGSLSAHAGLGHGILFGNAWGLCRLAYQTIDNPSFSFPDFVKLLFPELKMADSGLRIIEAMIHEVFGVNGSFFGENGKQSISDHIIKEDLFSFFT